MTVARALRGLLWWTTAVALGLGSAWALLRSVSNYGAAAGPWRASTLAGSPEADLYTRARVALGGLLALNREETMYYVASTDSAGQLLRARCSYRVSGVPPKARWWSVTAYAQDLYLFDNPQRRYSVNGANAPLDAQGRFAFVSGPEAPAGAMARVAASVATVPAASATGASAGAAMPAVAPSEGAMPWIPTPGEGGLFFTLRVYNPEAALSAAPGTLQAPVIELLGACP